MTSYGSSILATSVDSMEMGADRLSVGIILARCGFMVIDQMSKLSVRRRGGSWGN